MFRREYREVLGAWRLVLASVRSLILSEMLPARFVSSLFFLAPPRLSCCFGLGCLQGSTKGKHVDGNVEPTLKTQKKARKYRQYMNRKGGFNRLLANQQ